MNEGAPKVVSDFYFEMRTQRLRLVIPEVSYAYEMLDFFSRNQAHLSKTSPPAPEGFYTASFWKKSLADSREQFITGKSAKFVLLHAEGSRRAMGMVNFSNVIRGAFQACYLGYHLDEQYIGKGYMYEATCRGIEYAFNELKLHRIMANYLPENERSERLLERLGFEKEGIAKKYLYIENGWRDHVMTALVNENLKSPL